MTASEGVAAQLRGLAERATGWMCDWMPDELNPGPDCPYCANRMCARFDGLGGCRHTLQERHGYYAALSPDRALLLANLVAAAEAVNLSHWRGFWDPNEMDALKFALLALEEAFR